MSVIPLPRESSTLCSFENGEIRRVSLKYDEVSSRYRDAVVPCAPSLRKQRGLGGRARYPRMCAAVSRVSLSCVLLLVVCLSHHDKTAVYNTFPFVVWKMSMVLTHVDAVAVVVACGDGCARLWVSKREFPRKQGV